MKFTKNDLMQLENILRALKNGNFTMQGMEILAFSDCMRWASNLHKSISDSIKLEEQLILNPIVPEGSPFKEQNSPIKAEETSKLKKKK